MHELQYVILPQAKSDFWKAKYDHEAAKQARTTKKAERKATKTGSSKKKKPSTFDLLKLDDSSLDDEEVIFKFSQFPCHYLSDILSLQEDTGNSQAANEEVTIISSDSEPLPKRKTRRVTRKVRFSHALAYQDPQFILKQQQLESRRQTRNNKDAELSSGLPDVTR